MNAKKLNQKAVTLLLENFVNNDSNLNSYDYIESDNSGIIAASLDYTLMITKATHDTDDYSKVKKLIYLYSDTDDGETEDYLKTVYGPQIHAVLKTLDN